MKRMRWFVLPTLLLLVACGGGTTTTETPSATAPTTETPGTAEAPPAGSAPTETAQAPGTTTPGATTGEGVVIKMGSDGGQLVFVPARVTVKPGDKITWLMNKAGPHNAVFENTAPDPAAARAMAEPKLLNKSGDKVVVTVPANAKPGDYPYYCTPHRSAGMKGVITVAS
jgi:plastocyanin